MDKLSPFVDFWKVGKINHNAELERGVDWHKFVCEVKRIIPEEKLLIKNALKIFIMKNKGLGGQSAFESFID